MPLVRNLSDKTIESYKISIKLYLRFINKEKHIINDKITFEIFSRENMTDYIIWLKIIKLHQNHQFKNDGIEIVFEICF